MGGGWRCVPVQRGGACPACSTLRRAELLATGMAEGELDVDSLISRLLEGEFANRTTFITSCCLAPFSSRRSLTVGFVARVDKEGPSRGVPVSRCIGTPDRSRTLDMKPDIMAREVSHDASCERQSVGSRLNK